MAESPVTELSPEESWDLLRSHELGRLAFHLADEVHLVPVNYAVDTRHRIVFRSNEGSKLLGLTMDADVAFEIDEVGDEEAHSVVVRGRARALEGAEADEAEELPVRPWVAEEKYRVVVIDVDEISGRRFRLHRPWLHLRDPDG